MSFSKFPHFVAFSLNNKEAYLKHFISSLREPYCDFSLYDVSIWLNYNNDLEVCILNDNIIFRFSNVLEDNKVRYTILGKNKLKDTLKKLSTYLFAAGEELKLVYIPEEIALTVKKLDIPGVQVEEDRKNNDYIYNVDSLVGLQGKQYENLRRRIAHFRKDNNDIQIKELDLTSRTVQKLVATTVLKWSSRNDPENGEYPAIQKHLKLAKELPVFAYGLYSNGVLININIFHLPPHKGWLIFNHIKCDYAFRDVYGFAFYSLFLMAQSKGIRWINFEQDLGLEGLRRIKTFFRPEKMLHRYTLAFTTELE